MSIHFLRSAVASRLLRPRTLNLVLAGWLSVSALLFPHLPAQRVVTLLAGIAALTLALLARRSVMAHRAVVAVAFCIILDRVEQHSGRDRDGVLRRHEPGPLLIASPTSPLLSALTFYPGHPVVRKATDRPALRRKNERAEQRSAVSPASWPWNERC